MVAMQAEDRIGVEAGWQGDPLPYINAIPSHGTVFSLK
jgi:hypothetical protein